MELCGIIQARSKYIGPSDAPGSVSAPAGCIEPLIALPCAIGVDRDENDIVLTQKSANLIDTSATFGQGDVRFLRHQERGVQTPCLEGGDGAAYD